MSHPALTILMPTCRRSPLLRRSLESLTACERPERLRQVIVIENGPRQDAEEVVNLFRDRLPIVYQHVHDASKSLALNHGLRMCDNDFVVFLDDDVRIHAGTLIAYANAADGRHSGLFIGGRCLVDYEADPPSWLLPYLPLSAKGWSMGESMRSLSVPHALGFNWGAFASDVRLAGGFDSQHGPGRTISIGEETRLQATLLSMGVVGWYLPAATVWHYVPRERCTSAWALRRAELTGYCAGEDRWPERWSQRVLQIAGCRARILGCSLVLKLFGSRLAPARRFHFQHRRAWRTGFARGLREGAPSKTVLKVEPAKVAQPTRRPVVPVASARS